MEIALYSLCFKTVTFGHNLRSETNKGSFGEISLKLRQTNWNVVARNNVNVVADELPSQSTNSSHFDN
jgi:hypothetical protein